MLRSDTSKLRASPPLVLFYGKRLEISTYMNMGVLGWESKASPQTEPQFEGERWEKWELRD
jgi:hypothetical protein